jgi:hypothetical protein
MKLDEILFNIVRCHGIKITTLGFGTRLQYLATLGRIMSNSAKALVYFHSKIFLNGWRVGFRLKIGLFEYKMTLGFILFTIADIK